MRFMIERQRSQGWDNSVLVYKKLTYRNVI